MKLSREGACIMAICVADLITTIWFVRGHGAEEANPLMRLFLQQGLITFILAKGVFCVGPLALIEWARRQHPSFVKCALRTGIALYLGFYGMVVWKINNPPPDEPAYTASEMRAMVNYAEQPIQPSELSERPRVARH